MVVVVVVVVVVVRCGGDFGIVVVTGGMEV
jgi:hypothetical protein